MKVRNFEIVSSEEQPARASHAEEMIAAIDRESSEGEIREVVNAINGEADQIKLSCKQEQREQLAAAEAMEKPARLRAEEHRPRLAEDEKRLRELEADPGNRLKVGFSYLGLGACGAAEFALTWYTLPFILSVRQYSILGVMLALAPTMAILILAEPLERLIERPWQRAQAALASLSRRKSEWVMVAFLVALSALNIYTVISLALARDAAIDAKRDSQVEVDEALLARAVILVSICVALDGAFFHLLAMDERKKLRTLKDKRLEVERLRAGQEEMDEQLRSAETEMAKQQARWEQVELYAETVAAHYRARLMFQLEQARTHPRPQRPLREVVSGILTRRFDASAASNHHAAKPFISAAA